MGRVVGTGDAQWVGGIGGHLRGDFVGTRLGRPGLAVLFTEFVRSTRRFDALATRRG